MSKRNGGNEHPRRSEARAPVTREARRVLGIVFFLIVGAASVAACTGDKSRFTCHACESSHDHGPSCTGDETFSATSLEEATNACEEAHGGGCTPFVSCTRCTCQPLSVAPPPVDAGQSLAAIGGSCATNGDCASGLCDTTVPFGQCYARCQSGVDADCGDPTGFACASDLRCYPRCTADGPACSRASGGLIGCTDDTPRVGLKICKYVPSNGDAGIRDSAPEAATVDGSAD